MEKAETGVELIQRHFPSMLPNQMRQWEALEGLYRAWNSRINLISRKDLDSLYEKHVLHSLSIAAAFDLKAGMQILDLGTGGGFPGIPLAIFFPKVRFHLIDGIGKKIEAVRAIGHSLGLNNLIVEQIRAEEIRGRRFDCVVSRAVAPLRELWDWSLPLLRTRPLTEPSGLICLKGGDLSKELASCSVQPRLIPINQLFEEAYFREKYVVYASRQSHSKAEPA
jgi:16S rRNA (guanine527-N7)-methyltransferase